MNASGGINGHPIKLIVKDDAGNPATALQDVKELVEQDKVIAIVGDDSLADSTWAGYVAGKGIPVVGGNPSEAPFASNPDSSPAVPASRSSPWRYRGDEEAGQVQFRGSCTARNRRSVPSWTG